MNDICSPKDGLTFLEQSQFDMIHSDGGIFPKYDQQEMQELKTA